MNTTSEWIKYKLISKKFVKLKNGGKFLIEIILNEWIDEWMSNF